MKRLFNFITLFVLCFYIGLAQDSPKKHFVSNGETLFSISRKYNITLNELQRANPQTTDDIKVADVLIIPEDTVKSNSNTNSSNSITNAGTGSPIRYTVISGDTKYGLAKRFGLTIPQLESQNPQIISGLLTGQVLKIQTATSSTKSETTSPVNLRTTPPVKSTSKEGRMHRVLKGETLFSISQANGLSVNQLINANSNTLKEVLLEGQLLWIPGNNPAPQGTYIVNKGDTKFSLARRFNMSIQELERQNPHIINMLQIGHSIKVSMDGSLDSNQQLARHKPQNAIITPQVSEIKPIKLTEVTQDSFNEMKKHVMANNGLTSTENKNTTEAVDDTISKPSKTSIEEPPIEVETPISDLVKNDNVATDVSEHHSIDSTNPKSPTSPYPVRSKSGYYDLRSSASTSQPKNILFFLPFSEKEYQEMIAKDRSNFNNITDPFIRHHLEFYKGAKIAIDSLNKMNLNVMVDIVEMQSSNRTSDIKPTIPAGSSYDAFILPFYRTIKDEDVAKFISDSEIPVITATSITGKNKNNYLYSAAPSINLQRIEVLNYIKSKQAHIIVLSDYNRLENKAFISGHAPNTDFVEISDTGSFSERELIDKFKKDQLNFVIIDSERNGVFINATNTLLTQFTKYKLQLAVLESSIIPDETEVSLKRYRILNMIFPSLIPARSTENTKQFSNAYQNKYELLPTTNVMLGFDITYDSLLRLMQQHSFETSVKNYITEQTQLKFNYKENNLGGYSNEGIYILQYDSDINIRDAN